MEIVGFVYIKNTATTCRGAKNPSEFIGQSCPVLEFNSDGDVLVLNPQSTAMAMFDKQDVVTSFECRIKDNIVCPPNLNIIEQMLYIDKCRNRKGGYNKTVMLMVIEASLIKGKFHDSFLWALQDA